MHHGQCRRNFGNGDGRLAKHEEELIRITRCIPRWSVYGIDKGLEPNIRSGGLTAWYGSGIVPAVEGGVGGNREIGGTLTHRCSYRCVIAKRNRSRFAISVRVNPECLDSEVSDNGVVESMAKRWQVIRR